MDDYSDVPGLEPKDFARACVALCGWLRDDVQMTDRAILDAMEDGPGAGRLVEFAIAAEALEITPDSDWDLLVILSDPENVAQMAAGFWLDQERVSLRRRVHGE